LPDELKPAALAIGPNVTPRPLAEALSADTIILAVPFSQHQEIGKALPNWAGKLVIDATNAYGTPLEEFGGLTSSAVVARAFPGASFVKAFNHLPAAKLADNPNVKGGRRVIFMASDTPAAATLAKAVIEALGYAPVSLGTLAEGAVLTQARGHGWSPLTFQDLVKPDGQ
jgi:predicted dinucleotide-binding enzyme